MYICAHKTLKIWRIEYLKEKYTTKVVEWKRNSKGSTALLVETPFL